MAPARVDLPIDALLPQLTETLRRQSTLVLEAPPGAGKTTRVPGAVLPLLPPGQEVVVLQPRRLATRLAATRIAEEMGEPVGQTVGYQVRFEDVSSPRTRIRFVTEGILSRRLLGDPTLKKVGAVIFDEFHERHLASDIGLAMVRRLQQEQRPELKLLVMSATLDAGPIAQWLGQCPVLRSEGRRFDVALEHLPQEDTRHLDAQVEGALKRLVTAELDGHVLVFLPGAAEIRRAHEACAEVASRHQLELHTLHGELAAAEQDRALRPSTKRKVIFSTNVAETSVTIEGIAAVIDSGLARVAAHSPWSGMPTLKLAKVSRASATQRAGRAGRTRAGRCLRLYTKSDFEQRAALETPEIRRADLAETVLGLRAAGVENLSAFPFFEAPAPSALEAADALLRRLGASDANGQLTDMGRRILRFPLYPRLGRLLAECEARGLGSQGAAIASLLGERDIRTESRVGARLSPHGQRGATVSGSSDVLELLERFENGRQHGPKAAGLDTASFHAAERSQKQLQRMLESPSGSAVAESARQQALLQAVLTAFPDRVAKRRRAKSAEVLLSGGGSATVDPTSVVQEDEWLVAVDAEERKGGVVVKLASRIEPEWLLERFAEDIKETDGVAWNASSERVERLARMTYGALVLDEVRQPAPPSEAVSLELAKAALSAGIERFVDAEAWSRWKERIVFLKGAFPNSPLPSLDAEGVKQVLARACEGSRSFSELRALSLLDMLQAQLPADQAKMLTQHAPERLTLPHGRSLAIHYEPGKPPWVESRLQDFFGLSKGPALGGGRVPLVMHLLAPNQRAVQVTTDLAGFWERHYPTIRKELMRKYPRHFWPEDPLTAQPPPPKPPRR
ncbi:MAG: ATP-dependent helicase HrpB [Myxococcaceae bacterium]|nr:ATP-dependent helicase HrpB [Myxococcaceae bacterium]